MTRVDNRAISPDITAKKTNLAKAVNRTTSPDNRKKAGRERMKKKRTKIRIGNVARRNWREFRCIAPKSRPGGRDFFFFDLLPSPFRFLIERNCELRPHTARYSIFPISTSASA
jgi:hypothetical protein